MRWLRRHAERRAPFVVAALFAVPIFLMNLLTASLAVDTPRLLAGGKEASSSAGTEAKVWLVALIAPAILLAIGALAVPLGRYGVYAAIGAAIVMCALMPSVSNSYADDHARRFPQGLDYIVDTSPSNASSRGEWEHAAHESIVGMAEWTLVLVGLALAAALFVHVRGRRGAPVPPPPAVAGVGETSPVVGPDPS